MHMSSACLRGSTPVAYQGNCEMHGAKLKISPQGRGNFVRRSPLVKCFSAKKSPSYPPHRTCKQQNLGWRWFRRLSFSPSPLFENPSPRLSAVKNWARDWKMTNSRDFIKEWTPDFLRWPGCVFSLRAGSKYSRDVPVVANHLIQQWCEFPHPNSLILKQSVEFPPAQGQRTLDLMSCCVSDWVSNKQAKSKTLNQPWAKWRLIFFFGAWRTHGKVDFQYLFCGGGGSLFWPHPSLIKQRFATLFVGVGFYCFGPTHPWLSRSSLPCLWGWGFIVLAPLHFKVEALKTKSPLRKNFMFFCVSTRRTGNDATLSDANSRAWKCTHVTCTRD